MKKRIIIIASIVALLITFPLAYLHIVQNTDTKTKEVLSLLEKQKPVDEMLTTKGYTFEEPFILVNPYEISPLTAMIMFETKESVEPVVTIHGKDKLSTFTHTFPKSKEHYLNIYGLYADKTNKVTVKIGEEEKTFEIKTDKLLEDLPEATKVKATKSKLNNDLYFFSPASNVPPFATDVNGDIRWYITEELFWKIDRLNNGNLMMSTERMIAPMYYQTGMYEINLMGKIITEFQLPGGYHHCYHELESGNLLVSSDEFNNEYGTIEDIIVEIDRETGEIIKTWDLKNILLMDQGKSESWTDYDWFHNNSVWYDKEKNSIILSGRHQDAVISIDYSKKTLNWIIGDKTNWDEKYHKYFFEPIGDDFEWQWSQHAAMVTPEGYIFILDNGNNKSKIEEDYVPAKDSYTRGVMYEINEEDMTIKQIYQYGKERGSDFYSPYISDVDYIAKDHYITHSGGIVEVDGEPSNRPAGFDPDAKLNSITVEQLNNKNIFEIQFPLNIYRTEKMSLYEREVFSKESSKTLGTLGKTKLDDKKIKFFPTIKEIDKFYKDREIEITKESDRLVVSGRFHRGSSVNIILSKNLTSYYYNIPVTRTPYTALCITIFTEEETENGLNVTKFVNEEGIKGNFDIYLEIDDVVYNTKQNITFK